ncbi:MAG: hypothetical protein WCO19_01455 [Candidatus Saccharibacteria bacterium]
MIRQTPVRSYNTVHNKIQNARTAFSSKFFVILAIVIAGTVVFFSGRFYLAEKNGTNNGDATVASESDATTGGTASNPSTNGAIWKSAVWSLAILSVFVPLAIARYRSRAV